MPEDESPSEPGDDDRELSPFCESISEEDNDLSSTMSLPESIMDYIYEHGRRYHSYQQGSYVFPNDELEQDRLELMHHLWQLVLDGKLFSAPIDREKTELILDVGTGTGVWAIDVAESLLPTAEILGNDLSPIQPVYVPKNLRFEIDDVEADWPFPNAHFDFIHVRNLVGSIRNWPRLYKQAFRTLKPGGWIELKDGDGLLDCDNGSLTPGCALQQWAEEFDTAAKMAGISCRGAARAFKQGIIDAGFVDVQEDVHKVPLGPWAEHEGPRMKEIGAVMKEMLITGAEGLTLAMFTRVLGWEKEQVDGFLAGVKAALGDSSICAYTRFITTYGRKPV